MSRQFKSQRPNLPDYVANQVLQNRVAPLWKNTMSAKSTTIPADQSANSDPLQMTITAPVEINPNKATYGSLKDMFKDSSVSSIADKNNWQLEIVDVHPLNFTQDTITSFLNHQFGSSPSLSKGVKNHDERMQTQSNLAGKRGQGKNEPIIMIREGDKFRMQEGWHRLYSYLLQFSAPPEEVQKIQNGQTQEINFSIWKPIKIKAYIGS